MMAERRCGKVEVGLDVARGGAFGPPLNDVPQDLEAGRMSQGAELFGVTVESADHDLFLIKSKQPVKD